MLGEDRGDVAVRAHPEQADVEDRVAELGGVGVGGRIQVEAAVAGAASHGSGRGSGRAAPQQVERLLGVAVGVAGGHEPLVAPPELDPATSPRRSCAPSSASRSYALVAIRPPVSASWGTRKSRWISASRAISRAASASATSSAELWTTISDAHRLLGPAWFAWPDAFVPEPSFGGGLLRGRRLLRSSFAAGGLLAGRLGCLVGLGSGCRGSLGDGCRLRCASSASTVHVVGVHPAQFLG